MWTDYRRVPNLMIAEMWKDVLEGEGFPTKIVGYGTDIPVLRPLGKPLLFGPGSIFEAHTADEKISKQELLNAVDLYQKLVRELRKKIDH